jgi:two-component system, OmpR family, KDP operon response regulator KdpE
LETVVLLEGDEPTRRQLAHALSSADLQITEAADGLDVLRKVFALRPTAVLMDLRAARMDALEMIRVLRAATDIPLVVIGESTPGMAVRALDMGADDYLERPLDCVEVVARVRATIRRYHRQTELHQDNKVIRTGALVINRDSQQVTKAGLIVPLTRTEYRLLDALALRAAQVAPHRYLLSAVWGEEYLDDTHYLRVYIGYLRMKLEDDPGHPQYLVNEWGTGYRLAVLPIVADGAAAPQRITSDAEFTASLPEPELAIAQ